jgi:hypothetical protein
MQDRHADNPMMRQANDNIRSLESLPLGIVKCSVVHAVDLPLAPRTGSYASARSSSCGWQGAAGDRQRRNSWRKLSRRHVLLFSRLRPSLAPQTNSRTSSHSGTHPATSHGNSPHTRCAPALPVRCAASRSSVPAPTPKNSLRRDPLQLRCHSPARKTCVHFQRQTFRRVHVDHGPDEDLGGSSRGLGVSGVDDRRLYSRDRGVESLALRSDRRRVHCG